MSINWTNVTTPEKILAVPNLTTDGSFWSLAVFMIWIVETLALLPFGIDVALLASLFTGLVASFLLAYAGLVGWWVVLFFFGFFLFLIWYLVYSSPTR